MSSAVASAKPGLATRTLVERILPGRLSTKLHSAALMLLLWWPYSLASREFTLGVLLFVSTMTLVNRPLRFPKLSPLLLFFFVYFLFIIGLEVSGGKIHPYVLEQSNHIVQFVVYYIIFSKIVQNCDWLEIVTSGRFLTLSAILSIAYYLLAARMALTANTSDMNITLLALLLGLFVRGQSRRPLAHFLGVLVIVIAMIATTGRLSVLLLTLATPLLYWVKLPRGLTNIAWATIALVPIAYYLTIDSGTVLWLYNLDHNTGIRADFIRGAVTLLKQAPFFGVGFGEPYRPINFAYTGDHPLLTGRDAVYTVSNHHSVFDIALRLGIPAAIIFWWGLFYAPIPAANVRAFTVLCLVAAIGLSFNAWLENQYMLPQLTLVIAIMHAGQSLRTRRGTSVAGEPA